MFNLGGPRARRHKARLIANGKRISVFSRGLGNGRIAWIADRQLFSRGRNAAVSPIFALTAPDPDPVIPIDRRESQLQSQAARAP